MEPSYDDEYNAVYSQWGSPHDSLFIVIPMTLIYILIFITGIIGNVTTCIIILRNKSMHTATNYYLFSLAISDLLLLIFGLPIELYVIWCFYPYIFGDFFCTARAYISEGATYASVLTITAFTVERYIAICHPFLSHTISELSRVVKMILMIWVISLCVAPPVALQYGVIKYPEISSLAVICNLKNPDYVKYSFELTSLIFFFIPMTLIPILYWRIWLKLRKSKKMKKRNIRNQGMRSELEIKKKKFDDNTGKSSQKIVKMLAPQRQVRTFSKVKFLNMLL
ncbi:hypothetical protein KQX54_011583 [Cotesia glomerata]|uniref:G-protein coupled receptors family 1 profile domain-containing protein n=1 Tax=Cotesia glomerata TaxID=32391 RepID=A0AAV7IVU3_COTGL|nr:hypothetical protein KQX54_011583 [Cotesia glomerata]